MTEKELSAAKNRLERVLSDETYGPKLVRMNRKDEAHILDLISQNRGREARKEILRLDEVRRKRELTVKRVREYRKKPKPERSESWKREMEAIDRNELEQQAYWELYKKGAA